MFKIGAHVSSAIDVSLAPKRAQEIGCECFQFFSRPPQGGPAKPISSVLAKSFKANLKKFGQAECYIHTPYFINLASAENRIFYGSVKVIREELERGSLLGAKYVMTHLGSAKDLGRVQGLKKTIDGLAEILKDYQGRTKFLIEMSAGAGEIIGDKFEEIKKIINSPKLKKYDIGVCFDTAHAFASGYDLRNAKAVGATFKKFSQVLGLKRLRLVHANDSMAELNSKKDRHEHIGRGKIGLAGFKAIVALAKKNKVNLILETPHDSRLKNDLQLLKTIRGRKI